MDIQIVDTQVRINTADVIGDYSAMSEQDWKNLRKTGIGGSDAGVILGYSKYKSPLALWMEKTGRVIPDDLDNEAIQVGNWLEPIIRRDLGPWVKQEFGAQSVEVIDPQFTYASTAFPWMLANVDGFVAIDGELYGLEIKTGSSYMATQWANDQVPDSYYCQVQHYMEVLGLNKFLVFGLIGNRRILRVVPYNEMFCEDLVHQEKHFWELVQANDPLSAPLPQGTDSDMEALKVLIQPGNDDVADLTGLDDEIREYLEMAEKIKDLEHCREVLKQRFVAQMGTSKKAVSESYLLNWSPVTTRRIDTKALEANHPEIADLYKKESSYIRLSVRGTE
jgi:putative phage-type endonuclease